MHEPIGPVTQGSRPGDGRLLGIATGTTVEDPFGPGDPLVVARLVRRSLAAAKRRAHAVRGLVVVTDRAPSPAALARFTRRALGPHGAGVASSSLLVPPDVDHAERVASAHGVPSARASASGGASVTVVVVLGPRERVTVLSLD